jgi:hypothetical protein
LSAGVAEDRRKIAPGQQYGSSHFATRRLFVCGTVVARTAGDDVFGFLVVIAIAYEQG